MNEITRSMVALSDAHTANDIHSATIFANELTRDGISVDLDGMDFSTYEKNPVVLYAHDFAGRTESSGLPIGRTLRLVRTPGSQIRAEFEFLPGDPFAARVQNAWRQGFLRGASIGWRAIESRPTIGGVRVTRSELVEWSIVAVPSDPDALRDAYTNFVRALIDGPHITGEEVIFQGSEDSSDERIQIREMRERLTGLLESLKAAATDGR